VTPEEAVRLSINVANEGLAAGEMPIGALVLYGDDVLTTAYPADISQDRRIVHSDILAMEAADRVLRHEPRLRPVTLVVNLEPCIMCLGAAMTLRVDRVWFGVWSPADGGVDLLRSWKPPNVLPFFKVPDEILGGFCEAEIRSQFGRYAQDRSRPAGMRTWCASLA
jgi:tRNA(adenine34) deaminase